MGGESRAGRGHGVMNGRPQSLKEGGENMERRRQEMRGEDKREERGGEGERREREREEEEQGVCFETEVRRERVSNPLMR